MSFFPDATTFLKIGDFTVKWYAVLILIGAYLAFMISRAMLKRNGTSYEAAEDLFLGCLAFGIIGARLWYCVFYDASYYFSNPINLLKVYEGGLAIQGGLIAGGLFAYCYCRANRLSFLRTADAVLPNVFLAQAIGRWGNFVNQEAYGRVVEESFYNLFPEWFKSRMFIDGAYREPTFFYESIGCLLGFVLFSVIYRRSKYRKRGSLAYSYLMGYGLIRFWIEAVRSDSLMLGIFKMAQLISLAFIAIGVCGQLGLFDRLFKKRKPVLLFDLDGTLLDTQEAIFYSFTKLFEHYSPQTEVTKEILNSVLGPTLESSIRKYFPKEDTSKLVEEYRRYNVEAHKTLVKPMDGCAELLAKLTEEGYRMAIVSTKRKETVELGLDQFGLKDYFEVILGSEEVENSKPDPEGLFEACRIMKASKDNAVYIGDSATDIEAARRAGMYSIGVIFNPDRKQALQQAKPNRTIEHLSEIEEILKEEHAWTYNMM